MMLTQEHKLRQGQDAGGGPLVARPLPRALALVVDRCVREEAPPLPQPCNTPCDRLLSVHSTLEPPNCASFARSYLTCRPAGWEHHSSSSSSKPRPRHGYPSVAGTTTSLG